MNPRLILTHSACRDASCQRRETGSRTPPAARTRRICLRIRGGVAAVISLLSAGLPFASQAAGLPRSAAPASVAAPVPATAHVPVRTLALATVAEVTSDGVFLDQVLTVAPPEALPHLRITNAPAAGESVLVTRAQVSQWIQANAPDLSSTNWAGVDRVRISRKMRGLDELEVRGLLLETLQTENVKEKGELELRLTRAWSSVQIPDEPISLRMIDLPATGPGAHFIVRFELWSGEERLGNWQASLAAKIWSEVPVAQAPLKRGQLLASAPIHHERRDVLALRDAPGVFELNDASLELVENIAAGHPILARSVRPRPVVFRGQPVDAVLTDGGLTITLRVEPLQDGLPGQVIRVRNPRTRRELVGKVLNEQTILIVL